MMSRRQLRRRLWRRFRHRERGSAAIEAAIGVPAFILFVGLILFAGRVAMTHQAVQSAATEGARAASIARTQGQAHDAGTQAVTVSLTNQGLRCASTTVALDTSGFGVPVGTPAQAGVTVTCVVDLSDLTVPGVPGTRTITATMTSPIDTYREH